MVGKTDFSVVWGSEGSILMENRLWGPFWTVKSPKITEKHEKSRFWAFLGTFGGLEVALIRVLLAHRPGRGLRVLYGLKHAKVKKKVGVGFLSTARFRGRPESALGQNGRNGPLWGHLLKETAIFPFWATLDPRPLSPPCAMGSERVWAPRAPFGVSTNTVSPKSELGLEKSGWSKIDILGSGRAAGPAGQLGWGWARRLPNGEK